MVGATLRHIEGKEQAKIEDALLDSERRNISPHPPFALVLVGGGARGMAHAGVLRALERHRLRPSAIVGVSMGAIVSAAYALNPDWFRALLEVEPLRVPQLLGGSDGDLLERIRDALTLEVMLDHLALGWGLDSRTVERIKDLLLGLTLGDLLLGLTLGRSLEESRPPLSIIATDLLAGRSVVLRQGDASEAAYASCALAGVFPPLQRNDLLLADGGYADLAPIPVARSTGAQRVIVVDPDYYAER